MTATISDELERQHLALIRTEHAVVRFRDPALRQKLLAKRKRLQHRISELQAIATLESEERA